MRGRTLKSGVLGLTLAITGASAMGCHSLDDDRIPPLPVNIVFQSTGMWEVYGVTGASSYRRFIKEKQLPAGFGYTEFSYTGFGGVLLIADILGEPLAYDLACPVEVEQNVRVEIDPDNLIARCPVCGSEYDVFSNLGTPIAGPAVSDRYALTRYHVSHGSTPLDYMVITR